MRVKNYFLLFFYTFFFSCLMLLVLRSGIMLISYYNHGYWGLKEGEIISGVKMSAVASSAITLAAFIFKRIDIYNTRNKPPTEPDK